MNRTQTLIFVAMLVLAGDVIFGLGGFSAGYLYSENRGAPCPVMLVANIRPNTRINTAEWCGVGRVPKGPPETRDGLTILACDCPAGSER